MTPADELRTAAEKIRRDSAAAHRASPAPWTVDDNHVVRCADGMIVADRSATDHPAERADLPYIAAMHPDVGTALADWLAHAADTLNAGQIHGTNLIICESCCEQLPCQHIRPALAVARQINGTTP